MNKQTLIAAVTALIIGIGVGSSVVKIQLMDAALRNQATRLATVEGTVTQLVQFINQAQAAAQGAGQPQGPQPE